MNETSPRPVLPRFSLAGVDLCAGALFVAGFWMLSRMPLHHTDLWVHLSYGRYYAEHNGFPEKEPYLELARDEPFITSCWLAQSGGYWIERHFGNAGLQFAYAVMVGGGALMLFLLLRRRPRETIAALWVTGMYLALEWQQIFVIRPQLAGMLLFPILLACWRSRRWAWGMIPVTLLWTNLHGTFVVGLAAAGLMLAGEGCDLWRRTGRVTRVFESKPRRTLIAVWLASLAATLCNPFGWRLLSEVFTFAGDPNLYDLIEWKPIFETPKQGRVLLAASIAAACLLAVSRRRFRWRDWLPALIFGLLTFKSSRFIVWFGPLFSIALFPHVCDLLQRCREIRPLRAAGDALKQPIVGGCFVLGVLGTAAIAATGLIQAALGRQEWSPAESYHPRTPLAASRFLKEHPPGGVILNTMEWGDWLIWDSHGSLAPMVDSHVNWLPPRVWGDYVTLVKMKPGWESALARYPIAAAMLDRRKHGKLANELYDRSDWHEVYRDGRAVILQKTP